MPRLIILCLHRRSRLTPPGLRLVHLGPNRNQQPLSELVSWSPAPRAALTGHSGREHVASTGGEDLGRGSCGLPGFPRWACVGGRWGWGRATGSTPPLDPAGTQRGPWARARPGRGLGLDLVGPLFWASRWRAEPWLHRWGSATYGRPLRCPDLSFPSDGENSCSAPRFRRSKVGSEKPLEEQWMFFRN